MNCLGCYKENIVGYCNTCKRKLFDGKKISHLLTFEPPKADLFAYQKQAKSISISGVQLKFSLKVDGEQLILTEKEGQYILKPIPPANFLARREDAPENEHLTMQIARQLFKMPVAENALIYFNDQTPAFITRRFDVTSGGIKYLQEDFAQISGRAENTHGKSFKYTGTYEEIGKLIRKYVAAHITALESFFKVILFNYIFSNGDAHLKNFSLYKTDFEDYTLTKAYDLMCTALHTPNESDTALDLYEDDIYSSFYQKFGCYGRENFEELAKRIGLLFNRASNIIDGMLANQDEVLEMINKSYLSKEAKEKYIHHYNDKMARFKLV